RARAIAACCCRSRAETWCASRRRSSSARPRSTRPCRSSTPRWKAADGRRATMEGRKDFLSFWDLPDGGIEALILRAEEFRLLRSLREPHATRPGRVLGMVFEKASTRTRASFEIAMYELGGHALYLGMQGSQLERGEPLRDTARVLSGYCHAIMLRTFGHERVDEMARYATVPV